MGKACLPLFLPLISDIKAIPLKALLLTSSAPFLVHYLSPWECLTEGLHKNKSYCNISNLFCYKYTLYMNNQYFLGLTALCLASLSIRHRGVSRRSALQMSNLVTLNVSHNQQLMIGIVNSVVKITQLY